MRTILFATVLLTACGPGQVDVLLAADDAQTVDSALTFPAGETAQILALVNDPSTGIELLNELIALDRRAAINILAHRNGPDARFPTADDNRFDTFAELDGVAYVGDSALLKLRSWALAHPAPMGETVEGIAFTAGEVVAVLWGVNQAALAELDVDAALDGRAAASLIAGKPYTTIAKMGAGAFVGPTALAALRTHAAVWIAKRAGTPTNQAGTYDGVVFDETSARAALALANTATREALIAAGLPPIGAAPLVGNRPYVSLAQVAAVSGVGPASMKALLAFVAVGTVQLDGECSATNRCATGLVCAALSLNPTGLCRPSWMAGTFSSTTVTAIPDANTAGIVSSLVVSGLASVPEDIVVHLDIDHPRPGDLRVVLTQPSSAESIVWAPGSAGLARVVPVGAEYDSGVNGTWSLQVIDTQGGSVGTLRGWSLELISRYD